MHSHFRNVFLYLVLLLPVSVVGFWKTYFAILNDLPAKVTPLVHAHATLMYLWVLMLIAQSWFVRTNRYRLHQRVGRSSYLVAPLIIFSALAVLHEALTRTSGGPPVEGPEGTRLSVLGFGQVLAFGLSWGLAILCRKRPSVHVRFIVSTAFGMSTAIVFRIFMLWVPGFRGSIDAAVGGNCAVLIGLLFILIAVDWRIGMKRSPYWMVTIVLAVMHLGYWTFAKTPGWHSFGQWYADLPLT